MMQAWKCRPFPYLPLFNRILFSTHSISRHPTRAGLQFSLVSETGYCSVDVNPSRLLRRAKGLPQTIFSPPRPGSDGSYPFLSYTEPHALYTIKEGSNSRIRCQERSSVGASLHKLHKMHNRPGPASDHSPNDWTRDLDEAATWTGRWIKMIYLLYGCHLKRGRASRLQARSFGTGAFGTA